MQEHQTPYIGQVVAVSASKPVDVSLAMAVWGLTLHVAMIASIALACFHKSRWTHIRWAMHDKRFTAYYFLCFLAGLARITRITQSPL